MFDNDASTSWQSSLGGFLNWFCRTSSVKNSLSQWHDKKPFVIHEKTMVQRYSDLISKIQLTWRAFVCWNWTIFMKIYVLFSTMRMITRWRRLAIKCVQRLVLVSLKMINRISLYLIFRKLMFVKLNYISILRDMQSFLRLTFSSKMHQDRDKRNIGYKITHDP